MKTKCFLFNIAVLLLTMTISAAAADSDYEFDAEGTITKYVGWDTELVIPGTINGKAVRTIGKEAFKGAGLTSVTIPEGVVEIGISAFQDNQLSQVIISGTVRVIKAGAFAYNQLTELVIPEGVTAIENAILEYHYLRGWYQSGSIGPFRNNKLTKVTIPGTVKTIGGGTFANNQLTEVIIPEGVTAIGKDAFVGNNLKSLTLPASICNIDNIDSKGKVPAVVILADKMGGSSYGLHATLGNNVFFNYIANDRKPGTYTPNMTCVKKTEGDFTYYETQYGAVLTEWDGGGNRLRIPQEIGGMAVKAIGINYRYSNPRFAYSALDNIFIPEGITYIGDSAFTSNKFTQLTIPKTVTYIGNSAFSATQYQNTSFSGGVLTQLTIPESVTYIGDLAFYGNKLTQLTTPASIRYVGTNAFAVGYADRIDGGRYYASQFTFIIGANVETGDDSFGLFYKRNGKKAGRYTLNNGWSYSTK
jgi:hypothetical protein